MNHPINIAAIVAAAAAPVCAECGDGEDCACVVTCAACRAPEWRELASDGLCAPCARAAARDRRTQGGYLADPLAHLEGQP